MSGLFIAADYTRLITTTRTIDVPPEVLAQCESNERYDNVVRFAAKQELISRGERDLLLMERH